MLNNYKRFKSSKILKALEIHSNKTLKCRVGKYILFYTEIKTIRYAHIEKWKKK